MRSRRGDTSQRNDMNRNDDAMSSAGTRASASGSRWFELSTPSG
jgi:hypothetical protein